MATISFRIALCSLLFIGLSLSASASNEYYEDNISDLNVHLIAEALQNRGYDFMSLMYPFIANEMIPEKGVFTMFCVRDEAIKIQPSGSVIRSHVVPLKLNRESVESFRYGKKLDTVDPDHHLMITSTAKSKVGVTINDMPIEDWDIYNDGRIIIHGIRDYFEERINEKNYEL